MRNGLKKALALALTLLMMLSMLPVSVIADEVNSNYAVPREAVPTYVVTIEYLFTDGKQAADPWTAVIHQGSSLTTKVDSPAVLGYTARQTTVEVNIENIQADQTITVYYDPAVVSYTVKHMQQNIDDDEYTVVESETKTGYTGSAVSADLAKSYDGFTALLYDTNIRIAADGSTVLEIRYDRNYYLLSIDLDGGYGSEPVYGRYGMKVEVASPKRAGYTFAGWNPEIPATMPAENTTHTAQWEAGKVNYVVQYWQENANDTNYSYVESETKQADIGQLVSGAGDKSYSGFTFDHADQNVVVKNDGTTVVNVYYKRNVYEVRFYNNRGTQEDTSKRITAKYGAFIGNQWPGNGWYVGTDGNTAQSYLAIMPLGGKNFYGQQTGNSTATATYYVEVLPGETGTTVGGKTYKVHHTDTAKSSGRLRVTDEERYDIEGFTCNTSISTKNDSNYNGAKFYYTRNSYELVFDNQYGTRRTENLPFEQVLSEAKYKDSTPAYPSALEAGAYQFGGWYADPGCNTPVDWNSKMPAAKVVVYAKWTPVVHTVKTYKVVNGELIQTWEEVPHGTTIEKPENPVNGEYVFVGWFYEENGVEKAFDFSMPITKDLNLYAKWSSNKLVDYEIRYELEDGTTIADPIKGQALVGTTNTFEAKADDLLYAGYQTSYFPKTGSHSIKMDIDPTKNVFTFVYVHREKLPYTVRYLEAGTNNELADTKTAETASAIVTERYVHVAGYVPDAYQKRLVMSADGTNEIIFYYTKDELHAPVKIIHWIQNIDGDNYTEYRSSEILRGEIGQEYKEAPLTIPGFEYNSNPAHPEQGHVPLAEGVLTAEGLELNLYYDRIVYPYEFKFVEEKDPTKELASPEKGSDRYGKQVTQQAKTIPGYVLVEGQSEYQNIIIDVEDPANVASKNVRIFYYKQSEVTINYVAVTSDMGTLTPTSETVAVFAESVQGSIPTANQYYQFVGWFKDAECTQPVDSTWVNTETNELKPGFTKNYGTDETPKMGYETITYYAKFKRSVTNVTVRKQVTGNFGDTNKYFNFRIEVSGHNLVVVDANKEYRVATESDQNAKDSLPVQLKNGEFFIIKDVPIDGTLTVVESAVDGYQTSYTIGEETVSGNKVTYTVPETGGEILFTNHRDISPDTGVSLDALPYILIIACVAAIGAFVIIRRRKARED